MKRFAPLAALALAACQTAPAPGAPVASADAPDTMQWLYGSGEAAAASIQAFEAMAAFVEKDLIHRASSEPMKINFEGRSYEIEFDELSVRMGSTEYDLPAESGLSEVHDLSCVTETDDGKARKPYAVVFDIDETVLLNSGYEYWQASTGSDYDSAIWDEWERTGAHHVVAAPGAIDALSRIRAAGVTVVFNSNRNARNAIHTAEALSFAGLGNAVHGETLFLKGDDDMGSAKDGRRRTIAEKYCVIALAGDNLGDFADVFNEGKLSPQERRRRASQKEMVGWHTVRHYQRLWGNGWFLFSNPVYGHSITGTVDDVFPPAVRWKPSTPTPAN